MIPLYFLLGLLKILKNSKFMNEIIYNLIDSQLKTELERLSTVFNINKEDALQFYSLNKNWDNLLREKNQINIEKMHGKKRCMARTWNNGTGGQCSRANTEGSEFCMAHAGLKYPRLCRGCLNDFGEPRYHNYNWEHLGKMTDPLPKCIACRI